MNADCTFTIGSKHSICQDYVVASPRLILSDGCSSSPDTDIGARLLVKAAERVFGTQAALEVEELHKESARLALRWAEIVGVPAQSIDGTLMTAHVREEELIIACSGDGVIVLQSNEGVLDAHVISSPSGYPFYPSYVHQPERLAELIDKGRTAKQLQHHRRISPEEQLKLIGTRSSDSPTEVLRFGACDFKYAALASDGLHSFFKTEKVTKRVEAISFAEVLQELWSFKNSHGAFVQRRMKRFKKDCEAMGWQHADDLALGVIHLGA